MFMKVLALRLPHDPNAAIIARAELAPDPGFPPLATMYTWVEGEGQV
jgi:hypothetical protein